MIYVAALFYLWGIGYVAAMNVTVKGLPTGPAYLLFAVGTLLTGLTLYRKKDKEGK